MSDILEAGRYIRRLGCFIANDANRNLQRLDLTFPQSHVLMILERHGGTATLKELERQVCAAQSTVAGLVARLERKGLVSCFTDERDRRVKHVRLNDGGRELVERCRQDIRRTNETLLAPLGAEERTALIDLLRRIADPLQTENCPQRP